MYCRPSGLSIPSRLRMLASVIFVVGVTILSEGMWICVPASSAAAGSIPRLADRQRVNVAVERRGEAL